MHRHGGRLPHRPRGPRSGPGYSVPVRHHLIGLVRPTRRSAEIVGLFVVDLMLDLTSHSLATLPSSAAASSSPAALATVRCLRRRLFSCQISLLHRNNSLTPH